MARGEVRNDRLSWVSSGSVGTDWTYKKIPFASNAQLVQNTGAGTLEVAWGYSSASPVPTDINTFSGTIIPAGDARARVYYGRNIVSFALRGLAPTSYVVEGWVGDFDTDNGTVSGSGGVETISLGDLQDVDTTGQASGNVLVYNGSGLWVPGVGGTSESLPSQIGKAGDVLTTDGVTAAWTKQYVPGNYILCLGDSKSIPTAVWANFLQSDLNSVGSGVWTVQCQGVGGSTVASYLTSCLTGAIASVPAGATVPYVLVNFGANDCGSLPDETTWKTNYGSILSALHGQWPSAKVYLSKVWRRGYASNCATLNGWIDWLVANYAYTRAGDNEYVWLEGGDDGATYTVDGVHYSDAGQYKKEALVLAEIVAATPAPVQSLDLIAPHAIQAKNYDASSPRPYGWPGTPATSLDHECEGEAWTGWEWFDSTHTSTGGATPPTGVDSTTYPGWLSFTNGGSAYTSAYYAKAVTIPATGGFDYILKAEVSVVIGVEVSLFVHASDGTGVGIGMIHPTETDGTKLCASACVKWGTISNNLARIDYRPLRYIRLGRESGSGKLITYAGSPDGIHWHAIYQYGGEDIEYSYVSIGIILPDLGGNPTYNTTDHAFDPRVSVSLLRENII